MGAYACIRRTNGTGTNSSRTRSFLGLVLGWHSTKPGWTPGVGSVKEPIRSCRNTVHPAQWVVWQDEIVTNTFEEKKQSRCTAEPGSASPKHPGLGPAAALRSRRWPMRIRWLSALSDGTSGYFDRREFRTGSPHRCVSARWPAWARRTATE